NRVLAVIVNVDHHGGDGNPCRNSDEHKRADDEFSFHFCTAAYTNARTFMPVVFRPESSARPRSAPTTSLLRHRATFVLLTGIPRATGQNTCLPAPNLLGRS